MPKQPTGDILEWLAGALYRCVHPSFFIARSCIDKLVNEGKAEWLNASKTRAMITPEGYKFLVE